MSHSVLEVRHSRELSVSQTLSYAFTVKDVFLKICEAEIVLPPVYHTQGEALENSWEGERGTNSM